VSPFCYFKKAAQKLMNAKNLKKQKNKKQKKEFYSMGARTELILPSHDAVTSMRQHAPSSVLL
jgi:hypothetical protein